MFTWKSLNLAVIVVKLHGLAAEPKGSDSSDLCVDLLIFCAFHLTESNARPDAFQVDSTRKSFGEVCISVLGCIIIFG